MLLGKGIEINNVALDLSLRTPGSWAVPPGSVTVDTAQPLSGEEGASLVATQEFNPPLGTVQRIPYRALDVGSHESPRAATVGEPSR